MTRFIRGYLPAFDQVFRLLPKPIRYINVNASLLVYHFRVIRESTQIENRLQMHSPYRFTIAPRSNTLLLVCLGLQTSPLIIGDN